MSKKISQLDNLDTVLDADILPVVNAGATKKVTKQNLLKEVNAEIDTKANQTLLETHTSDGSVHFTQSQIAIIESQITNLDKYTQAQINAFLLGKAAIGHIHDDRYFTETETNILLAGKSDASHNHAGLYEPANSNIQAHIANSSNPHGVTKSQVGLSNVDNTSDLNKPISTATQTELNLKATQLDISTAISNLVNSAPGTLDTLKELATALGNDPNFATTIATSIATKVSKTGDTITGSLVIDKNTTNYALYIDHDVTNASSSNSRSILVENTLTVNDGGTYSKYSEVVKIVSNVIATSGTINDSHSVVHLEQANIDATGNVLKLVTAGGRGLVVENSTISGSTGGADSIRITNTSGGNQNYIRLIPTAAAQYPSIKWDDIDNSSVVLLTAHKNHPTAGDHRHFTVYTTDSNNLQQGRFYIQYGRADVDIYAIKVGTFSINNVNDTDTDATRANRNYTDNALEVEFRNKVSDGNTYSLAGNVARFRTTQVETSGTINNSVDGVLIEQFGKTGQGLVVDNRGTGKSISVKNNATEYFSVGATGNVVAAGTIAGSNLSGTNTGDETLATIKSKLGITILSGSNTGDQDLSTYAVGVSSSTDNAIVRFDGATGKLVQDSTVTISDGGIMTLAANKGIVLSTNTPTGGITPSIKFLMTNTNDRPWLSWYDENSRLRASTGYHTTDYASGSLHIAYEIKTSADPLGATPTGMVTRFSVKTDGDLVNGGFNALDQFDIRNATLSVFNIDTVAGNTRLGDTTNTSVNLSYNGRAWSGYNGANAYIGGSAGKGLAFGVNAATFGGGIVAYFNSSGNLGLGLTSAIDSKLTFAASTTASGGILFGTDTNLYRSAIDTLKTDDSFIATGTLTASNLSGINTGDQDLSSYATASAMNTALALKAPLASPSFTGSVQNTGDIRTTTYLRVGSLTAPNSTTAGDLTSTRLSVGNATLGTTNGEIAVFTGTSTNTASASTPGVGVTFTMTPTANSLTNFRALNFLGVWNPATGITQASITTGYFDNRIRGDGLVGTVTGIRAQPFVADSSSALAIQATNVYGFDSVIWSRPSGTSTGTITNGVGYYTGNLLGATGLTVGTLTGFQMSNPAVNTITTLIGMDIAALTRGAMNIGLRIAAPSTGATANYALQLSDTGGTAAGGITFGTDVQLYRSAALTLAVTDGTNIALGTTIGTKIGTATTQKLGFFNAVPVVKPAALTAANATATDGTIPTNDSITNNLRIRINELESRLQSLGLVA